LRFSQQILFNNIAIVRIKSDCQGGLMGFLLSDDDSGIFSGVGDAGIYKNLQRFGYHFSLIRL
jgi:hypothetical protein